MNRHMRLPQRGILTSIDSDKPVKPEPLLFSHTTLLEISYRGSVIKDTSGNFIFDNKIHEFLIK